MCFLFMALFYLSPAYLKGEELKPPPPVLPQIRHVEYFWIHSNYTLSDLGEVPQAEGVNSNQKIPSPSGEG